jgi:hypothetical protein
MLQRPVETRAELFEGLRSLAPDRGTVIDLVDPVRTHGEPDRLKPSEIVTLTSVFGPVDVMDQRCRQVFRLRVAAGLDVRAARERTKRILSRFFARGGKIEIESHLVA